MKRWSSLQALFHTNNIYYLSNLFLDIKEHIPLHCIHALEQCRSLRHLSLTYFTIPSLVTLTQLHSLKLSCYRSQNAPKLPISLRQLTLNGPFDGYDLSNNTALTFLDVQHLQSCSLPCILESLSFSYFVQEPKNTSQLTELSQLSIGCDSHPPKRSFLFALHLTSLSALNLNCGFADSVPIEWNCLWRHLTLTYWNVRFLTGLGILSSLEYLRLEYCTYLEDITALHSFHELKTLVLRVCPYIVSYEILKHLSNLEETQIIMSASTSPRLSIPKLNGLATAFDINFQQECIYLTRKFGRRHLLE
jgi:hypothetical protein